MCYELEWFHWKRATEAQRKREQLKTATERTPAPSQPEPIEPATQAGQTQKVQEELEPV